MCHGGAMRARGSRGRAQLSYPIDWWRGVEREQSSKMNITCRANCAESALFIGVACFLSSFPALLFHALRHRAALRRAAPRSAPCVTVALRWRYGGAPRSPLADARCGATTNKCWKDSREGGGRGSTKLCGDVLWERKLAITLVSSLFGGPWIYNTLEYLFRFPSFLLLPAPLVYPNQNCRIFL